MNGVEELVQRAAQAAASADADELRGLRAARTRQLQAAFAYAKRREQDPTMSAAADMLEIALVLDRKGALTGARWWHRTEVVLGVVLIINGANMLIRAWSLGWLAVVAVALLLIATVLGLLAWRRAVAAGRVPVPVEPGMPPSAGRLFEIGERVLAKARAAVRADVDDVEELADLMREQATTAARGPRAALMAVGALSYAERLLAASLEPRRATLLAAACAARRRMLEDVPQLG